MKYARILNHSTNNGDFPVIFMQREGDLRMEKEIIPVICKGCFGAAGGKTSECIKEIKEIVERGDIAFMIHSRHVEEKLKKLGYVIEYRFAENNPEIPIGMWIHNGTWVHSNRGGKLSTVRKDSREWKIFPFDPSTRESLHALVIPDIRKMVDNGDKIFVLYSERIEKCFRREKYHVAVMNDKEAGEPRGLFIWN